MQALENGRAYDWPTWLIGIMRSFLSGGAAAFLTLGGGALTGVPPNKVWIMVGINFVAMGAYRLGEFLQLHGAPDKVVITTEKTESTIQPVGDGVKQTSVVTTTVKAEDKPPTS